MFAQFASLLDIDRRSMAATQSASYSEEIMDKIAALKEILAQDPASAFARYGLAMAYASEGDAATSLAEFDRLLVEHPDYTAGYFMAAQTLVKAGRPAEAQTRLRLGIASAQRTGNQHALSEMQQLLDELQASETESH
jgi:predicted Zn-dependent protease